MDWFNCAAVLYFKRYSVGGDAVLVLLTCCIVKLFGFDHYGITVAPCFVGKVLRELNPTDSCCILLTLRSEI